MPRLYPRTTLKKILNAHDPGAQLSENVDLMLYLDYLLFLKTLAEEASLEAQLDGVKTIRKEHVEMALEKVLQQFKI
ncbi:hypothetical protein G9A89_005809 [Geosiphon pyriformis]|nr:hypothetical protein G9A89_005809 [Geosiphon pyriformis]